MSKIYQNLLFISLFLLSHLLPPNMSQWVPGSTCPKDKTQVCCYGTPLSCYSWTWPCEEFEIAQCCRRIDNVQVGGFDDCQDPIVPDAQQEPARDSNGQHLKPDPDFNTEFGADTSPPPTPEAPGSTWYDWLGGILAAPLKATRVDSIIGNPASP